MHYAQALAIVTVVGRLVAAVPVPGWSEAIENMGDFLHLGEALTTNGESGTHDQVEVLTYYSEKDHYASRPSTKEGSHNTQTYDSYPYIHSKNRAQVYQVPIDYLVTDDHAQKDHPHQLQVQSKNRAQVYQVPIDCLVTDDHAQKNLPHQLEAQSKNRAQVYQVPIDYLVTEDHV